MNSKTGITLQENARDEHGIEKLDGLFSSPEKSSPKRRITNGNAGNSTLTSSSMKVQESMWNDTSHPPLERCADIFPRLTGSGPEPTEVLSSRRLLKSSKTTFPPPAGRSPFKTNIGSSPRRQTSVAPPASRPLSSSPIRATSAQPAVNRRLDFSVDQIRQSVEVSPRPVRSAKRPNGTRVAQTRQRDIFSLQPSVSPARANGSDHAEDEESEDEYRAKALAYDIIEETVGRDDGPMFNGDDDAYEAPLDHGEEEEDINQPISSPLKVTGTGKPRGRPSKPSAKKLGQAPILEPGSSARKTRQSLLSNPEETPPIAPVAVMQSASKTKKGKAPQVEEEDEPQEVIEDVDESAIPTSAGKKRGRSAKLPVHQDEEPEEEVAESVEPPAKKQRKTKAKAPRERDPNKKMGPPSAAPNAKRSMSPSKRPTQPRTLTMLRAETPANENMQRTRSGRTIIKPLAHWLGEKAEHNYDGSLLEVIRAQSVDVSRSKSQRGSVAPKGGKSTKARRQKQKADSMDAIEEEEGMEAGEEEQEEWEVAGQILRGPVKVWDNVAQRTIDEEEIQGTPPTTT